MNVDLGQSLDLVQAGAVGIHADGFDGVVQDGAGGHDLDVRVPRALHRRHEGADGGGIGLLELAGGLDPEVAACLGEGDVEDGGVLPAAQRALVHAGEAGGFPAGLALHEGVQGNELFGRELLEGLGGQGEPGVLLVVAHDGPLKGSGGGVIAAA
jgi:hypothetical protein